jgi:hypothetical protein
MRMDADAFGRAMIDCDKHRGLAFTGNRRRQVGAPHLPRSTVDWDTSQADDFRTRGEPWTIKQTRLGSGRTRRIERKGQGQ